MLLATLYELKYILNLKIKFIFFAYIISFSLLLIIPTFLFFLTLKINRVQNGKKRKFGTFIITRKWTFIIT